MSVSVTLSELTGKADALFGKWDGPIRSVLLAADEAFMHSDQAVMDKIFKKVPSTHHLEGYGAFSAMDDWVPVGENGEHPVSSMEQVYLKPIINETWKNSFSISRELIDDHRIGDLRQRPQNFVNSYHRSRQKFFANLLVAALLNKPTIKYGAKEFDTTCADKTNLFGTHQLALTSGTQSNAFSDQFSATALFKAITQMENLKDDKGNYLNLCPDMIILPNEGDLVREVTGVLEATRDPDTPGSNKGNGYLAGRFSIVTTPLLNDAIVGTNIPWMIMDSNYNTMYDCLIDQQRVDLEISSHVADNDALVWNGYARFGGGFVDYRAIAAGGLSYGSAL